MGERCLRSVSVKARTDWIDAALGVRVVFLVVDLGMKEGEGVGSSNLTRLLVAFIAPDAVAVVILGFLSNDHNLRSKLRLINNN